MTTHGAIERKRRSFADLLSRGHGWERFVALRCWPTKLDDLLAQLERVGFSAEDYHQASPDLLADFETSRMAAVHFLRHLEEEVVYLRPIPATLDFAELNVLATKLMASRRFKAGLTRKLLQAQIDNDPSVQSNPAFWRDALTALARAGAPVIVAGDSHSMILRHTGCMIFGKSVAPLNLVRGGASAIGLGRALSRSGYGENLTAVLRAAEDVARTLDLPLPVLFVFGQVDLEFVYTFRCLRDGTLDWRPDHFARFCEDVVAAYLTWIQSLGLRRPIVIGVNPPCLRDDMVVPVYGKQMTFYQRSGVVDEDGFDHLVAKLSAMRLPDQKTRTENHRLFNRILRVEAGRADLAYADTFDALLGTHGLLAAECSSTIDGSDIHVGGPKAVRIKRQLVERIARR